MAVSTLDTRLLAAAKEFAVAEYGAKFFTKPTPLMWIFWAVLEIVTWGKIEGFMERFTTCVGTRVYFGSDRRSPLVQAIIIFHECRHMKQHEDEGRLYFTWKYLTDKEFRAKWEREAYQVSTAARIWRGEHIVAPSQYMINNFTGASYNYMDPDEDRVRAYLQDDIDEIHSGMFEARCEFAAKVKSIVQKELA